MGQFSGGQINKAVLSFTNSLTEYVRVTQDISNVFFYSKSVHTSGV